jgi:PAS domain S-box-containing protein
LLQTLLSPQSYSHNLYALPPFIAAIVVLLLGVAVFAREQNSRAARQYFIHVGTCVVWLLGYSAMYRSAVPEVALWWARVGLIGVAFFHIAVLHFGAVMLGREHRARWLIRAGWLGSALFLWIGWTRTGIFSEVHRYFWGYYPQYNVLGVAFTVFFFTYIFLGANMLVSAYRRAKPGSNLHRRVRGFLAGFAVGGFAAVDFLPAFGISIYPFGYAAITVHFFIAAYVTWRYRLIDVTPEVATQEIVATMTDALVVLDTEKNIRFVNPAATQMFGIDPVLATGMPLSEVLTDESAARKIMALLDHEALRNHEISYRTAGNSMRVLSISAAPVHDRFNRPVAHVCIFHDITEQKRIHEELELRVEGRTLELAIARDQALDASRTKSAFLANMSHELRTPLGAIIGYAEILQEEMDPEADAPVLQDLERIRQSGLHLLSLVNMVLDLSKIEAGKMELVYDDFTIAPMLWSVADTLRPLAEKRGNTLHIDHPSDIGSMWADQTKVQQTLLNIGSNACKFTENGEIHIRVRRKDGDGREWIEFVVSDTGIGMSRSELDRVFREFTQAELLTSRKYGGTGLGLSISKRFCELMDGNITVNSDPGRGSVFVVRLPARNHYDHGSRHGRDTAEP